MPPYSVSPTIRWSPVRSSVCRIVVIAAMPEDVASAASAPSSAASLPCRYSCDGVEFSRMYWMSW